MTKQLAANTPKKKQMQKKPTIRVTADQLNIPAAVFKQQDGVKLPHMQASQIDPNSGGIALMNIDDALPCFGLNAPVSTEGIALLILDYEDDRIPQPKQLVKVPAQCIATQEPMLVSHSRAADWPEASDQEHPHAMHPDSRNTE